MFGIECESIVARENLLKKKNYVSMLYSIKLSCVLCVLDKQEEKQNQPY